MPRAPLPHLWRAESFGFWFWKPSSSLKFWIVCSILRLVLAVTCCQGRDAGLLSILRAVISWFLDVGSKSGPPFRGSSESVLGTFGLVSSRVSRGCPWQRAPVQQSAWRPWKPLCHGLQPECWIARLVRSPDARVSVSVIVPGHTCVFPCTSTDAEKECRARCSLGDSHSRPCG